MNKVCKVNENDLKIIRCLYDSREGLRTKTISKLTNLKQRTLYKRLNLLREQEIIENVFPIWKIVNGQVGKCAILLKDKNIFELHNLSYVLKLVQVPDWWNKRKNKLIKLKGWQFSNVAFGKGSSNPYQQIINESFVIQCYKESIIIISRKRYYSNNPHETIINAMNDVLDIIAWFEERMKFKFFKDGIPALEIRNNDFNRMKDFLAERCKKEGRRFLVETEKGKVWVDYSEPFGKESNTPDTQETLERVTRDYIMNKPLLNSELQELLSKTALQVNQVTSNQLMFNKNFESHVESIKQLGNSAEANSKTVELLAGVINDLKEEVINLHEEIRRLNENKL